MALDLIFPFIYEIRLGKTKRLGKKLLKSAQVYLMLLLGERKSFY